MHGWLLQVNNMPIKHAQPEFQTPTLLLAAFVGLLGSLAFSWHQPDWSLALLLAVLLSKPKAWVWVLPSIGIHDLFLYWSVGEVLPYAVVSTLLILYTDKKLGPGQPQRWAAIVLHAYALWAAGMGVLQVFLSMSLTVWLWYFLSAHRERVYVEPA